MWFKAGIPYLKDFEIKQIVEKSDFKTLFVLRMVSQRSDPRLMKAYLETKKQGGPTLLEPRRQDVNHDLEMQNLNSS